MHQRKAGNLRPWALKVYHSNLKGCKECMKDSRKKEKYN